MPARNGTSAHWHRPTPRAVGKVLLAASEPLSASRIAKLASKDASNVKRAADDLVDAGLLVRTPPPEGSNGGPGRPTSAVYALAEGHEDELRQALETDAEPGQLAVGLQIVFVETPSFRLAEIDDVLAHAFEVQSAKWAALCDGEPPGYLIAFEGETATESTVDLMSVLSAAEISSRRVTPLDLMAASVFEERLDRRVARARATRLRRAA